MLLNNYFPSFNSLLFFPYHNSGDLARRLQDGRIQFVGRNDMQIKVNGFRIEPGDIINAMPSCVSSAKVVKQDNLLVLYVTPQVDKHIVVQAMEQKLPTYMIPRVVIPLQQFPLNKNKKVDTQALIEMGASAIKAATEQTKASSESLTPLQQTVQLVWSEVLHVSDLSVHDNFFEMGGTSLSAVVMSRRLSQELRVDISVQDIFAHQSIQSFCDKLEQSQQDLVKNPPLPLPYLPGGRHRLSPLAFGILQALGLAIMSFLAVVPTLGTVYISTRAFLWYGNLGFLLFPPFLVAGCLVHMVLVALCKWLIVGRYIRGKAKIYSFLFLKWWLVRRILHVSRLYTWTFDETCFSRYWMLALGAKVGKNLTVEQPYLLEPDLVRIGDNCTFGFETQFATAEIKDGNLEFRPVNVGSNVLIGVRAVLLGGSKVHNGCQVGAKAAVDYDCSSTRENQVMEGSPATISEKETDGSVCRPDRGVKFAIAQLTGVFVQIYLFAGIAFVGIEIAIVIRDTHGTIPMIVYLGAVFLTFMAVLLLLVVAILSRILIRIQPNQIYTSTWFALRKWFLDRLFLSPLFTYASQRTLQTSSTFPWYLQLLGAKIGKRAWMNHPYIRTGIQLLEVGNDAHMGMLSYFTTETSTREGISFGSLKMGNHVSFGQRCVVLGGSQLRSNVTVGAETLIPTYFEVDDGGTTFGSPPVLFTSSLSHEQIIQQTQEGASQLLHSETTTDLNIQRKKAPARRQDVGKGMFWTYVLVTLALQAMLPVVIGGSYAGLYFAVVAWVGELRVEFIILSIPFIYILGSMILMLLLKLMQMGGGSFSVGTANFFSWRFFYWHIFADMVYLCTSTVIYPFSGTVFYSAWLRFMGAKVGNRAFISPENGGFREIDFLDIGNHAVLVRIGYR